MSLSPRSPSALSLLTMAVVMVVVSALPVAAQDGPQKVTVAQVNASRSDGPLLGKRVTLDGRAIEKLSSDEYLFRDGTGTLEIDVDSSSRVPLDTLIRIVGTVASSEIDVETWTRRGGGGANVTPPPAVKPPPVVGLPPRTIRVIRAIIRTRIIRAILVAALRAFQR